MKASGWYQSIYSTCSHVSSNAEYLSKYKLSQSIWRAHTTSTVGMFLKQNRRATTHKLSPFFVWIVFFCATFSVTNYKAHHIYLEYMQFIVLHDYSISNAIVLLHACSVWYCVLLALQQVNSHCYGKHRLIFCCQGYKPQLFSGELLLQRWLRQVLAVASCRDIITAGGWKSWEFLIVQSRAIIHATDSGVFDVVHVYNE